MAIKMSIYSMNTAMKQDPYKSRECKFTSRSTRITYREKVDCWHNFTFAFVLYQPRVEKTRRRVGGKGYENDTLFLNCFAGWGGWWPPPTPTRYLCLQNNKISDRVTRGLIDTFITDLSYNQGFFKWKSTICSSDLVTVLDQLSCCKMDVRCLFDRLETLNKEIFQNEMKTKNIQPIQRWYFHSSFLVIHKVGISNGNKLGMVRF